MTDSPVALDLAKLERAWADYGPPQPPLPLRVELYPCWSSTSDRQQQRMEQGAPAGTVVIAQQQTQGRGQQGRQWVSPPGGLYLSLGLRPNLPAQENARLTLGSAWGIAQAFQEQQIHLELKWPNDLLLQNRKLGGILTESKLRGNSIHQAMIGVGLNWANSVPAGGISLKSVLENQPQGRITSLEGVAALVLRGLLLGCQRWQQTAIPLTQLLKDYEKLIKGMGQAVQIGQQQGIMTGIAPTGELIVRLGDRTLRFPPGAIKLGYD